MQYYRYYLNKLYSIVILSLFFLYYYYYIGSNTDKLSGTIIICKKVSNKVLDIDLLQYQEQVININSINNIDYLLVIILNYY